VDLQCPVVEETALLVAPVRGVAARLVQLLEEWPEHPILSQLAAICGRLLGGGLAVTMCCQPANLCSHADCQSAQLQVAGAPHPVAAGRHPR